MARGISLGQHVFPGARERSSRNIFPRSVPISARSLAELVDLAADFAFLDGDDDSNPVEAPDDEEDNV